MPSIEYTLLISALLLFMSVFAGKAGYKFGVPVLLLFLGVGMLAGNDGLNIVSLNNASSAQAIGVIALTCILFSGGMDTKYGEIKPVMGQGVMLSTVGVLLTAVFTGVFIYYATHFFFPALELTFLESLLLASVMSSTDSASVFALLRSNGLSLSHRLRPMLELESGSNDPMAYMLTISLIQLIQTQAHDWATIATMFFLQLLIGAIAGYVLGRLTLRMINRINVNNDALYPIILIAAMLLIFSATYFIKGNSYLAVYIGGMVIGNKRFVHKRTVRNFFDGMAWLCQIVMFLTLGLLVNPKELPPVAGISIVIGVFMIILARPAAVMLSLLPFRRMTFKDRIYISWVGLRGAVPIVFATYPLIAGIHHAEIMFNIVFFCTIISLLVQGTTLSKVAKWLKLAKKAFQNKMVDFDVEFAEEIKSETMEVTVTEDMLAEGHRLMDLRLPDKTLVVMIKRKDNYFIPKGNTELKIGDKMLLLSNDEDGIRCTLKNLGISTEDY
ncbi:MAG: potassium/proton antiporter [Prevotellaceae bacterium]|nr:potassium/proton antiporter [Prevotellaceae bacterium]